MHYHDPAVPSLLCTRCKWSVLGLSHPLDPSHSAPQPVVKRWCENHDLGVREMLQALDFGGRAAQVSCCCLRGGNLDCHAQVQPCSLKDLHSRPADDCFAPVTSVFGAVLIPMIGLVMATGLAGLPSALPAAGGCGRQPICQLPLWQHLCSPSHGADDQFCFLLCTSVLFFFSRICNGLGFQRCAVECHSGGPGGPPQGSGLPSWVPGWPCCLRLAAALPPAGPRQP